MTSNLDVRQLVVCCDGTNNNITGGAKDTNVVKLCDILVRQKSSNTLMFYDPGVGNPGELPGATWVDKFQRQYERILGLALGRGVYENIAQTYLFLMRNYKAGDQIFIFGFSRGAFTARSVAGLVSRFGILEPQMESMIPTLLHLYFSKQQGDVESISKEASHLFANGRRVNIQCVSVWDTVESVGIGKLKMTGSATIDGKSFLNVRHAVSLDEHRAQFIPRLYLEPNGNYKTKDGQTATLQQMWFKGGHCDTGGGYEPTEAGLSNIALCWLLSESVKCGFRLTDPTTGALLDTEAAVANVLASNTTNYKQPDSYVSHSELTHVCLWALVGMAVRKTHVTYGGKTYPIGTEHPSVAAVPAQAKAYSAGIGIWIALLIAGFIYLAGNLYDPHLIREQLLWWLHPSQFSADLKTKAADIRHLLVWETAFLFFWAYVVSWMGSRGFAKQAQLQRLADPTPFWLNVLGWSVTFAIFGDIAENVFLYLALISNSCSSDQCISNCLTRIVGSLMSVASMMKWLGLFGIVFLCLPQAIVSRVLKILPAPKFT